MNLLQLNLELNSEYKHLGFAAGPRRDQNGMKRYTGKFYVRVYCAGARFENNFCWDELYMSYRQLNVFEEANREFFKTPMSQA